MTPEQQARQEVDRLLTAAGWHACGVADANIHSARGVAIREFGLDGGDGYADYLLYVDGKAAGVIEAKKAGVPLIGVEHQSGRYVQGVPATLPAWRRPVPFAHESPGAETRFCWPMGEKKSAPLGAMLQAISLGNMEPEFLSSVSACLARLDAQASVAERAKVETEAGGLDLTKLSRGIV